MRMRRVLSLERFQRRFLTSALKPGVQSAALSMARGNGKSTLSAYIALESLRPGSALFAPGVENHLVAAALAQSRRTTFAILRRMLDESGRAGEYKVADSAQAAHIIHTASRTKLSVLPASGKSAMGLVNCALLIADEPASWKERDGELMHDAIEGAHGKPGGNLRVLYVGTLAPAGEGHWWTDLVGSGSTPSTHVTCFGATPKEVEERWDNWHLIRRCNPLMSKFPESRRVLLAERDRARRDTRLQARFASYRLNCPTSDEKSVLLTVAEWSDVLRRVPPFRMGRPIVGVDIGGGRAWSSAVGLWPNGRTEAVAIAPGVPSIEKQERRDGVSRNTYARLVDQGSLIVAEGLQVPPVGLLVDYIRSWSARAIVCDRFRLAELVDANPRCRIIPRVSRWSSSTEDIRALRRACLDGPLSVAMGSRALLSASLAVARVISDDAGNVRLHKSRDNKARDDVAAALILAAGRFSRLKSTSSPRIQLVG